MRLGWDGKKGPLKEKPENDKYTILKREINETER